MLSICEIVRESGGWLQPIKEIRHTLKQDLAKDMPIAIKRKPKRGKGWVVTFTGTTC